MEQAVVIAQSRSVSAQPERRNGVKEARRQPSEAAVAQRGLTLLPLDARKCHAIARQHGLGLIKQAQSDQVVGKQLAHQELRRDVVELFAPLDPGPFLQLLTHECRQRRVNLRVISRAQRLAELPAQNLIQSLFHRFAVHPFY